MISFIQAIFISVFYFVSFSIFNSMLLLGYATVFTMFPVFALIFDEDVDVNLFI
jgi:phospholipid-translocating ATPase